MKLKFKLKEIRIKKNMSYRKVVELSKVSTRKIVNIELNITHNIPLITLLKLEKALEVKVSELYEEIDGKMYHKKRKIRIFKFLNTIKRKELKVYGY